MFKNENKGEGPNKRLLLRFVQSDEWLHLCVCSTVMCVSGLFVPFIGAVTSLLSPVPISLISLRQGAYRAFLAVVCIAVFISFLFGYTELMSFIFLSGFFGFIFSSIAKKTNSAGETILGLMIALVVFKLVFMGIMIYTIGENPYVFSENTVNAFVKSLKDSGVGEDIQNTIRQYINMLIPSILIMESAFEGFMNYLFVSIIERRKNRIKSEADRESNVLEKVLPALNTMSSDANTKTNAIEVYPIPPFEQWSFPRSLLTAFFLAFFVTLLDTYQSSIILVSAELNLKILTFLLFFIQGLSFVWWWTLHKKLHYGMRLSIIFILLFVPNFFLIFTIGIVAIGILDIALNLRQRMRRTNS